MPLFDQGSPSAAGEFDAILSLKRVLAQSWFC